MEMTSLVKIREELMARRKENTELGVMNNEVTRSF